MSEFIPDDTQLSLADKTGFQSTDDVDSTAVQGFVDEVNEKRSLYANPYFKVGIGVALASFIIGFGLVISMGPGERQVAEEGEGETSDLTLSLEEEGTGDSLTQQGAPSSEADALRAELALVQQQLELAQIDRAELAREEQRAAARASTTPHRTRLHQAIAQGILLSVVG